MGLGGCGQLARLGIGDTPIAQVTSNPSQHPEVTIHGQVVNLVSLFGQGAYDVRDNSGDIWVVAAHGVPALNTTVTVEGTPLQGLSLGSQTVGVALKEVRRF